MTTNDPAWMTDVLACYPYLLDRLRSITQVKKVFEAKAFADISSDDRQQIPLDGAVYVMLDSYTPTESNANGREQMMEIGFSVILTKQQFTPTPNTDGVGQTLTAISQALQGFDPKDDKGRALTVSPFRQRKPLAVLYKKGFAYFPTRFTAEVAIISDN